MFTGIITHIGTVESLKFNKKKDYEIAISVAEKIARKLEIGASVACSGICLTLVKKENSLLSKTLSDVKNSTLTIKSKSVKNSAAKNKTLAQTLFFQASQETINCTNLKNWRVGSQINIEFAMRFGDEFGGHFVSGHVDGCAKLKALQPVQDSVQLTFAIEKSAAHLKKFIAKKGSICLDGVSLTVNSVTGTNFSVNLIPHSLENTAFKKIKIGDVVNVEIDLIARYLENFR